MTRLILASTSAARRGMLAAAGVAFECDAPHVDEDGIRAAMAGGRPRDIADALAELKAVKVSRRHPQALVLGADQLLVLSDGTLLDKPIDRAAAKAQLHRLQGQGHRLVVAAVIAAAGVAVWRTIDIVELTMRPLSEAFIDAYLDREGDVVLGCVGAYRLEALGAQLFMRVDGGYFTVLGLPLLAVLDYLRTRGVIAT